MKILLIDNYDSFTYNLFHYISNFKKNVEVIRNDKIDGKTILRRKYDKIVISPGPGNPNQAGNCLKIVKEVQTKEKPKTNGEVNQVRQVKKVFAEPASKDDIDPIETNEWIDSLNSVIENDGSSRASYLLNKVIDQAYKSGLVLPHRVLEDEWHSRRPRAV